MIRIILGVLAGFIVWTILWLGSDQVLINLSRDWYGAHQFAFENAMFGDEPFVPDTTILLMHLARTALISLASGFIAAFVAGENRKAATALAVALLLFGAYIQFMAWTYLPIWYHIGFFTLLVPLTITGGRLQSRA